MASNKLKTMFRHIRKAIYLVVLVGLIVYLYSLGAGPWQYLLEHWAVFVGVACVNVVAIFVQAASFYSVRTDQRNHISMFSLVRIWAFSGIVSLIAPIFAGLAMRTTLLVEAGMALSACMVTSVRQLWMGLEYAFLIGGLVGMFVDVPGLLFLAVGFVVVGVGMALVRVYSARVKKNQHQSFLGWVRMLRTPVVGQAHLWFVMQILVMSVINYVVFNGFGAEISWLEAVLLATATILASVIVVIPNGLGVLDALWVFVASSSGLLVDESVALALAIRLTYLVAGVVVWLVLWMLEKRRPHAGA